ncbi:ATP-dependent Clp protease proteolytic subunit [bacterium]|jgi:ATP-dependent Clp protease protease subunit|nr:ATP-dependent Clp protease proteolytic subunit [bacterium]
MDELYDGATSTGKYKVGYSESDKEDTQLNYYREFDYGIDTTDNVILIQDEITSGLTFDIVSKVRLLKKINGDISSINILLNSPGGDVIETLALIDFIQSQKEQGITFNIIVRGAAMSAAALLLTCGTGVRAASKHSKIMVHQLSTVVVGKLSDIKSNAKFSEQLEDDCNQLMADYSKMDKEYWEDISSSDYFMSADKALELGIIDKVI